MLSRNLWLAVSLGLLATSGVAEEAEKPTTQQSGDAAQPLPFILNDQTLRMLDRSKAQLLPVGNGGLELDPRGGHRHVVMARVGADGKIEMYCADSVHTAQQWANSPQGRVKQ